MLVHEAHSHHKLAIIGVINIREDAQKKAGPETIQILQKLPSLVPTSQLLCDVARRAIERTWKIREAVRDGLAVLLPRLSPQHSPVPGRFVVRACTVYGSPPKANHEIRNIERAEMHDVRACGPG
jgi:hypothetical protein